MYSCLSFSGFTKSKFILLLLFIIQTTLCIAVTSSDVQYWVGEGSNNAYLVVDFNDEETPESLLWGYHFDGESTDGLTMLNAIAEADSRVTFSETGGFLNAFTYIDDEMNHDVTEEGDYWSIWSCTPELEWNMGSGGFTMTLPAEKALGLSYGFSPEPVAPDPYFAVTAPPTPASPINVDDVNYWVGTGSNDALLVIDWQDDTPAQVWGFHYTYMVSGRDILDAITEADSRLTRTGANFITDMSYTVDGTTSHVGNHEDPNVWSYHKAELDDDGNFTWEHLAGLQPTLMGNNKVFGFSYGINDPSVSGSDMEFVSDPNASSWDGINADDVNYWVGEGANNAYLVVDFNDEETPESLLWGYHFDGESTDGLTMLNAIAEADPRVTFSASDNGFLNAFTYVDDEMNHDVTENGDWWSIWSCTPDQEWNMGSGGFTMTLPAEKALGLSYGFSPEAVAPDPYFAVSTPIVTPQVNSFDEITYWVGEGTNQAGLIIDWLDDVEPQSIMWGYRWDGDATGEDMLNAIATADPRLGTDLGTGFVSGLSYDVNNDENIDTNDHQLTPENLAFWLYSIKSSTDEAWTTSGTGISGRQLTNGCWDGWIAAPDYSMSQTPSYATPAEPAVVIPDPNTFDQIEFWIGEGANQAGLVIDWFDGVQPRSLLWGYRWDGDATGQDLINAVAAADQYLNGDYDAMLRDLTYDLNHDGVIDENDHDMGMTEYPSGYWSYWVKDNQADEWGYSNNGIAGRQLTNGCWDGWTFVQDWSLTEKPYPGEPVADQNNNNPVIPIATEDIVYWVGEGANQIILVVDFKENGEDNSSFAWGYKFDNERTNTSEILSDISQADHRFNAIVAENITEISFEEHSATADATNSWNLFTWNETDGWNSSLEMISTLTDGQYIGCSFNTVAPNNPTAVTIPAPIDNNPVANNDIYWIRNDIDYTLHILKNDTDDDEIDVASISITTEAEEGTADINEDGTITYNADAFVGETSFSYKINDNANQESNEATVTIHALNPFTGTASDDDSEAIQNNHTDIVAWATACQVDRGPEDITNPDSNDASFGEPEAAVGEAEGDAMSVVSLGDGGSATLTFESPICDLEGPDFAIFENGFADTALEIAFVEVSSNGEDFVRFPTTYINQNETQLENAGVIDARGINNFAGKYRGGFGTPFDLNELADTENLDIQAITHVRVVDVVGSINPEYATTDSNGNIINDPFTTAFYSCGFDLDGVAVIHDVAHVDNENNENAPMVTSLIGNYPNPFNPETTIAYTVGNNFKNSENVRLNVYNIKGQLVKSLVNEQQSAGNHKTVWNGKNNNNKGVSSGVYFYRLSVGSKIYTRKCILMK